MRAIWTGLGDYKSQVLLQSRRELAKKRTLPFDWKGFSNNCVCAFMTPTFRFADFQTKWPHFRLRKKTFQHILLQRYKKNTMEKIWTIIRTISTHKIYLVYWLLLKVLPYFMAFKQAPLFRENFTYNLQKLTWILLL